MSKKRNAARQQATGAEVTDYSTETSAGTHSDSKNTESPTTQSPRLPRLSAPLDGYFSGRFYRQPDGRMCGTATLTQFSQTRQEEIDLYLSDLSEKAKSAISEHLECIISVIYSELGTTVSTAISGARVLKTVPSEKERLESIIGTGSAQRDRLLWDWQEE